MIDRTALITAARAKLTGDAALSGLVGGVFWTRVPATVDWSKPVIELGIQAADRDTSAEAYGDAAPEDIRLRVMAHDRGPAPGIGAHDDLYAALKRADDVLLATALTVSGAVFWWVRWESAIPETSVDDEQGYPRLAAGNLYKIRGQA